MFTHLVVLPRWFGAPPAMAAVALGCLLADDIGDGISGWLMVVAVLSGLFLMAWAHSMNTFLDYCWTKLDQGMEDERSKPKSYTVGQQVIADGTMKPREVFLNALTWLIISAGLAVIIHIEGSPWVWLPWALVALCTFWYSWGKLHYQCELALGFGFGSFAVMFGMTTAENPELWDAFLAGVPFLIIFGFAAEVVDQAFDADANWERGLRNLGAYCYANNVSVVQTTAWLIAMGYISQVAMITLGILAPESMMTLWTMPLIVYGLVVMGEKFNKVGVLMLLGAVFAFNILLVVGQAMA